MDHNHREEKKKSEEPDWSGLHSDIMRSVLKRLNVGPFHQARAACSSWYSASQSCVEGSQNKYPWLIIFPEMFTDSESCTLYDPIEEKTYTTKHHGIELSTSTYGNWLLLLNQKLEFSILNVFSGERINLPPVSVRGNRVQRTKPRELTLVHWRTAVHEPLSHWNIKKGMLWIDEKTKDFVVSWIYNDEYLFSYKKGDAFWWYFDGTSCVSMAYKDQKLYVLTKDAYIKIFDFSGHLPKELVEEEYPYRFKKDTQPWRRLWKGILAKSMSITKSGDVLIILSVEQFPPKPAFCIYKLNTEGIECEWEEVKTIGEEEILVFGDGLTLAAGTESDASGDSIYFVANDVCLPKESVESQSNAGVYNLKTTKSSWCPFPFSYTNERWFVPQSDVPGSDKKC